MIKYFHELTKEELKQLDGQFWAAIAKDYPQPSWCKCPEAVDALECLGLRTFKVDQNGQYCDKCKYKNEVIEGDIKETMKTWQECYYCNQGEKDLTDNKLCPLHEYLTGLNQVELISMITRLSKDMDRLRIELDMIKNVIR